MRRRAYVARNGLIGGTSSNNVLFSKGPSRRTSSHKQRAAPTPQTRTSTGHGVGKRGKMEYHSRFVLCALFSGSFLVASYAVDYIGLDEDVAGRCGLVLPYHSSTGASTWLDSKKTDFARK